MLSSAEKPEPAALASTDAHADVVTGPQLTEVVAFDRQFADELGQPGVVRFGAGRGTQAGYGSLGDVRPVQVILAAFRVKEDVTQQVAPGDESRVERLGEAVGDEDIAVAADDDGRLLRPEARKSLAKRSMLLGSARSSSAIWTPGTSPISLRAWAGRRAGTTTVAPASLSPRVTAVPIPE